MSDTNERSVASTGSVAAMLTDREMAVEILRLRVAELEQAIRRLAEQDATLSVCDGNVIVEMDATLTPEERDAVGWAFSLANAFPEFDNTVKCAATLRGLLERTK